ncbi:S-adenosyl-L-methionine-dependent methyltransferase [Xylariaceae sp. FL1019]|nr:S-adenosyl-L-methionine-dependent methyltransferase [Xylariaceae sp. FL1019]
MAQHGDAGDSQDILEIDNEWDRDSAIGSVSLHDSTRTLNSSIYDHVVENGRTYHRFKEGKYMLPNDEKEQTRLEYQHELYVATAGGKLSIVPNVERVTNVLDIGTGTGIWAVEFALENPGALVTGIDLSPIQPAYAPPNVTFEISDAEDEWSFRTPFDLIHMRATVTCFKSPKHVLREAYRNLKPGGYIEIREPILPFQFLNPPPEPCALQGWGEKMMSASVMAGRDWGMAAKYSTMLGEIGFTNICERREAVALNPWVKGKRNKEWSLLLQQNVLNMLEPMTMALFTRVLGWEQQRVFDLLEDVRRDVVDTRIHSFSEG